MFIVLDLYLMVFYYFFITEERLPSKRVRALFAYSKGGYTENFLQFFNGPSLNLSATSTETSCSSGVGALLSIIFLVWRQAAHLGVSALLSIIFLLRRQAAHLCVGALLSNLSFWYGDKLLI